MASTTIERALALAGTAFALAAAAPLMARNIPIAGVSNAEDLAPTADGRWVFASSGIGGPVTSGSIQAIEVATHKARQVYPLAHANVASAVGCGREVDRTRFAPHGVALSPRGDVLFVINHGERESIEIVDASRAPRLRWKGCILAPPAIDLNSVALARDGSVFVTVWPRPVDIRTFATLQGKVMVWRPAGGWSDVPGATVTTANGLLVTPDASKLYVSAYASQEVVEITRDAGGTRRRTLAVDFMPDNLRWDRQNDSILVAGQRAPIARIGACATGPGAACDIPAAIAQIDLPTFTVRCHRDVPLTFATTAASVGKEIWLGTFRGAAVVRTRQFTADECG